jgi:hypothetical protein
MPVATKAVRRTKGNSEPIPDVDGSRFCRHCKKRLPLSAFPVGPRRYICKAHLYERFTLPAKLRVQADEKRRILNKLWARCSSDAKKLGQTRIQLTQREIAGILEHMGFRIDLAFAVVPADASRVLSRDNVAVVVNEARRDLISAHRKGGVHMYLAALAAWRAADSRQISAP